MKRRKNHQAIYTHQNLMEEFEEKMNLLSKSNDKNWTDIEKSKHELQILRHQITKV